MVEALPPLKTILIGLLPRLKNEGEPLYLCYQAEPGNKKKRGGASLVVLPGWSLVTRNA
jgi:hypothetical protein